MGLRGLVLDQGLSFRRLDNSSFDVSFDLHVLSMQRSEGGCLDRGFCRLVDVLLSRQLLKHVQVFGRCFGSKL